MPEQAEADVGTSAGTRRADARRNEQALLDAAAAAFLDAGVDAPVRDIAARASVGVGTVYRHFPTRADLVVAVYQHQIEACAAAGEASLTDGSDPYDALVSWIDRFVDLLVTKHGLAGALRSETGRFEVLHAHFLGRLVPVGTRLLDAAVAAGRVQTDLNALELMRAVGNLCIGSEPGSEYDARRPVAVLLTGLRSR